MKLRHECDHRVPDFLQPPPRTALRVAVEETRDYLLRQHHVKIGTISSILLLHRANIGRLLSGTENRFVLSRRPGGLERGGRESL